MTDSNASVIRSLRESLRAVGGIPLVCGLVLLFILLGFPWDSLARRIAHEISAASGSSVSIDRLAPAWTGRGPVLRARDVVIEHPAVDRVRLAELEIAPRFSTSWLSGDPTLRVWAVSDLATVDGILELGDSPSYSGLLSNVALARLPLRLDATGMRISGSMDADALVTLDANGTLHGRVAFLSPSMTIESDLLPIPVPFSRTEGVIVILETGETEIESAAFEGEVIEGQVSGTIGLVHRSQSPPIDLTAEIRVHSPVLRQLAPGAGFQLSPDGGIKMRLHGTLDAPEFGPMSARGALDPDDGRRVAFRERS